MKVHWLPADFRSELDHANSPSTYLSLQPCPPARSQLASMEPRG